MPVHPNSLANLRPSKPWMTNNPKGPPRKWINKINAELREKGYKPVRKQDIEEAYMQLLNLTEDELQEMLKDKKLSFATRLVIKAMVWKDSFSVIERMLDRWIWKAIAREEIRNVDWEWKDIDVTPKIIINGIVNNKRVIE